MRCTLVLTGAPLAGRAADIATSLTTRGVDVDYVATEAALAWLDTRQLETSGIPIRASRPGSASPRLPLPDVALVCPATFNTINKVAAGIADTHVHSFLAELVGAGIKTVLVPMINDRLWNHPALAGSMRSLTSAGCRFVDPRSLSDDVRPVESGTGADLVARFDTDGIAALVS